MDNVTLATISCNYCTSKLTRSMALLRVASPPPPTHTYTGTYTTHQAQKEGRILVPPLPLKRSYLENAQHTSRPVSRGGYYSSTPWNGGTFEAA
jgi:hypothetical protein